MIPRGETSRGQERSLAARRSPAQAAFVALRPRQWVKNLLLFGGIIFAAEIGDPLKWVQAFLAFLAYCAASSAAYLLNDLRDVAADRAHPIKRDRPIARGELAAHAAVVMAGALLLVGLGLTAWLGAASVLCLLGFVALQVAYSLGLKNVVFVDVLAIAALFVVRAAAGAIAVDVRISPWLLICTGLLALFLALGKRRAELLLVEAERTPGRRVLAGYSSTALDRMLIVVAVATAAVYVLYCFTARDSYGLVVTVPFVVFGLGRYLQLVREADRGEEPENVLLGDMPILLTVAAWALLCAAILLRT